MALLVVEGDERPQLVRIDLGVVGGPDGVAAIAGVPEGAHWVAVLLDGGWRAEWAHVAPGDEVVGLAGARAVAPEGAVEEHPADDHDAWRALTSHVAPEPSVPAGEGEGTTRFDRLVAAHGGAAGVLDELERSFVEWVLPPDGPPDEAAGERWRSVVVALTAAGDPGVAAERELLDAAARTIAAQLPQLSTGVLAPSLEEALLQLVDDLRDGGLDDAAAALRREL